MGRRCHFASISPRHASTRARPTPLQFESLSGGSLAGDFGGAEKRCRSTGKQRNGFRFLWSVSQKEETKAHQNQSFAFLCAKRPGVSNCEAKEQKTIPKNSRDPQKIRMSYNFLTPF